MSTTAGPTTAGERRLRKIIAVLAVIMMVAGTAMLTAATVKRGQDAAESSVVPSYSGPALGGQGAQPNAPKGNHASQADDPSSQGGGTQEGDPDSDGPADDPPTGGDDPTPEPDDPTPFPPFDPPFDMPFDPPLDLGVDLPLDPPDDPGDSPDPPDLPWDDPCFLSLPWIGC